MNETALNCPWTNLAPGSFPLCEEALCAWVKQPANAYSNVLFFIVGFYLIYLHVTRKSKHGLFLGLCILFIGSASFAAHSSGTRLFGFFDFAAIFTAFSYYAAVNAKALGRIKKVPAGFLGFLVLSVTPLYFFTFLREIIFAVFVIGLLFSEFVILKTQGKSFLIPSNKKVLLTFGFGIIFLALDAKKIICDPQNHYFQMHALWHICDAVSLYFLTRHLDQHRS
jgi:hypothetical protein